jgi:protein SCO1
MLKRVLWPLAMIALLFAGLAKIESVPADGAGREDREGHGEGRVERAAQTVAGNAAEAAAETETPAAIGGPFALRNQHGATVTRESFAGKYLLLFFGFTFCPDVCPTELARISRVMELLPPLVATQVQPLFVSVDPERDTPQVLREYLTAFDPRIMGLTGSPAAVQDMTRTYRIHAAKVPGQGEADYLMDHTALIYLMRPDGTFATFFRPTDTADAIAAQMQEIVGK